MSESAVTAGHAPARPALGVFERFLTVWVALCIIIGIALGQIIPGVFHVLGNATVAQVNLPVAVLVWQMIVPMLLKIDPAALREVGQHWRGIASTVGVNWFIKPLLKALLAWIFRRASLSPVSPCRSDQQLHGRPDSAGCCAMHRYRTWSMASRISR